MAEPEIVQDIKKEVKKNPAVGIAGGVVLLLLLVYLYNRNKAASAATTPGAPGTPAAGFTPATLPVSYGDISQVDAPQAGPLTFNPIPVLVSGTVALTGSAPTTPSSTPTLPGVNPVSSWTNPLIPYGKLPAGTKYGTAADLQKQPFLTWNRIQYLKQPGPSGKLYGTPRTGGPQVLLYAPASFYH